MLQYLKELLKSDARLSYLGHIRNLVIAYLLGSLQGIFISWFIVSLTNGSAMALSFTFIFLVGGLFLALPVLLAALVILFFCRKNVEKYLIIWCCMAVIIVPLAWAALEFLTQYAGQFTLIQYLSIDIVQQRVLLVSVFAICCSFLYYRRTKKALAAI